MRNSYVMKVCVFFLYSVVTNEGSGSFVGEEGEGEHRVRGSGHIR